MKDLLGNFILILTCTLLSMYNVHSQNFECVCNLSNISSNTFMGELEICHDGGDTIITSTTTLNVQGSVTVTYLAGAIDDSIDISCVGLCDISWINNPFKFSELFECIYLPSEEVSIHVDSGAVYINEPESGIIFKSNSNECYLLTMKNGIIETILINCPN